MKARWIGLVLLLGLAALGGCGGLALGEKNPFLVLTEELGVPTGDGTGDGGGGGTPASETEFRQTLTLTFTNNHDEAEVETALVAWVNVSSIRSADQQDALLRGNYVQLRRELQLGTAFTLPPGTFVYNGPGFAGATAIRLGSTSDGRIPAETAITLITPDVLLMYSQPPVSCDSVAFRFLSKLDTVITGPVTAGGGAKTLAQVDAYQCDPLAPGLFLARGGGGLAPNEFLEGDPIFITFEALPDADGNFAFVDIGEPAAGP
jgi:hypothetical protein